VIDFTLPPTFILPPTNPMKRSAQVNVRLSPADMNLLRKAGKKLYPGLQVSNSTLVLTLARQRAQEILAERKK
jgi:uncharacterized protein (DUF1778 family)